MPATDYQPPVAELLSRGRPKEINRDQWFDYVAAYGFTDEHIPDLIRLASEEDLNWQDEGECYAPIHAYRALGQLRAETAIQPLISLLEVDDSDWFMEDLPTVFGMIGPACIPALTRYLNHNEPSSWSKASAAGGLTKIAEFYPAHRDECVQILTESLSRHQQHPPELNGMLVAKLLDLQATEAVNVIETAYKEGPMDEMVCGTWPSVQIQLGLATEADFTPEELKPPMPEGMESIGKIADLARELALSGDAPDAPAKIKAGSEKFKLTQFGKSERVSGKTKSSQAKSGFGAQGSKEKKRKRKRK